jgi:hypothetical protein
MVFTMNANRIILPLIIILGFAGSCKKEDTGPDLVARTGPDTTASIGDTVWLDASASSGSDYEILWSFHNQPGDDTITHAGSDSAFFIPMYNGSYQLKLTISKGSVFHSDYQVISVSGTLRLENEISNNTRLTKFATAGEPDYLAVGKIEVTAGLIVDVGVIIEFSEDASLEVSDGGKITAWNASFIAADSNWKGIHLGTAGNIFSGCAIENAGNESFTGVAEENASLTLSGSATLAFSGNTVSSSPGYGIVVKDDAAFYYDSDNQVNAFRNNSFVHNASGPMLIPVSVLSDMTGQDFENETEGSYIEIYGSSYPSNIGVNPWISDQGMPYRIHGLVDFYMDLAITAGVEMYFKQDAGLKVRGGLTVSGSSGDPVIMDGTSGSAASWIGVYVYDGDVILNYLNLLNAGNSEISGFAEKASLIVEDRLSMKNSIISGSGGIGLYLPGIAHIQYSDNFQGNTLSGNATSAIRIRMDDVTKVVSGNTISSAASVPAIEVHMGLDDPLGTWANLDADYDYHILETLTVKETKDLVIEAGAVLKMSEGAAWLVAGGLEAIGSAGSEVVFEGTESVKGHWNGIFLRGSHAVQLDYVQVRDAGGATGDQANIIVEAAATTVSITNSVINNSPGYGVLVKSGASDFGINDAASNNTLNGDLGGFFAESK